MARAAPMERRVELGKNGFVMGRVGRVLLDSQPVTGMAVFGVEADADWLKWSAHEAANGADIGRLIPPDLPGSQGAIVWGTLFFTVWGPIFALHLNSTHSPFPDQREVHAAMAMVAKVE